MQHLQDPGHNDNNNVLAGAATTLSLLSLPTDNSNSQHLNKNHIKCSYNHTHHHFLDYFNDHIPDDSVIYTSDIPFQYSKIEGRYTKFIGNPIDSAFIAIKRDHEFLISHGRNCYVWQC